MLFPYPVAVCDIGGTNCRISIQDGPDAPLRHLPHQLTGDFPGLGEAIAAATAGDAAKPRSVIACGAGPVDGRRLMLTNAPWVMDGPAVAAMLDLSNGLLLNDFEAQALSLPSLQADWVRPIGPVLPSGPGPRVILGPGTGLGIAALVEAEGRFVPVSSEACHAGFGPATAEEEAFWPHLERARGRITSESVLSGVGLERLHRARLAAKGAPGAPRITAADITATALASRAGEEAATVRCYLGLVARFAGDIAISFMATGGVTLAGGILPRIADLIDDAAFRAAFEDKAPVAALTRHIGTRLVTHTDSVLGGMAALAAHPDRFVLDYRARQWRE
ncbi:glucokinase [Lichenibacterium ramalinae]|uniref:Glucokinase n=1 Tax=Lichenibacterium ramalinae TaxID=2316527 RepID=A0A4V1RIH6_9HYPH|nr:glucokinase [Lichenibacterium ramalinae]RYB03935.1 glucokinase [Lichenibacterium ramalinae]